MDHPSSQIRAGTWYLVPTAFNDDGSLDLVSQRRLVDAAIEWGVDGLTVMGVMSEPSALTDDERTAALDAMFETVAGRVPIAVGCSAGASALVAARIRRAGELGAAAVMVSAPPLLRNPDLLPDFFAAAATGGLPLIIQDEPAATGVTMPVALLLRCVAASGATCVKVEDPPTPHKIGKLLSVEPGLTLFGGLGGVAALNELRRGAAGTMTGFAYPEVLRSVRIHVREGRPGEAASLFDRFLPLIVFEAQPAVGLLIRKEVLRRRGAIATNTTRGIVTHIDEATAAELDDALDRAQVSPSLDRLMLEAGPAGPEGVRRAR